MFFKFLFMFMIALSLAFTTVATYAYLAPAFSVVADERKITRVYDPTPPFQPIFVFATPAWHYEEEAPPQALLLPEDSRLEQQTMTAL